MRRAPVARPKRPRTVVRRCAPTCGNLRRPAVVWFGENLPADALAAAEQAVADCDLMLVVGTSGQVYPAAGLAFAAHQQGARVVVINPEATELDRIADACLREPSAVCLPFLFGVCMNALIRVSVTGLAGRIAGWPGRLHPGAAEQDQPRYPELDRHQRCAGGVRRVTRWCAAFMKVDKISTALGTDDGTPRHYRYGYGVLDENLNMQVDPGEKKVYFEVSDYTNVVFFENPR